MTFAGLIARETLISPVDYDYPELTRSFIMGSIVAVRALEILDSRGNPTVEAQVTLESGAQGTAFPPSRVADGSRGGPEV